MKAFWLSISNIQLLYLYTNTCNAIVITFVNIHWQCIGTSADEFHYNNLQSEVQHKVFCRSLSVKYQLPNCTLIMVSIHCTDQSNDGPGFTEAHVDVLHHNLVFLWMSLVYIQQEIQHPLVLFSLHKQIRQGNQLHREV